VQSKTESVVMEIDFTRNEVVHALNNLTEWMKPDRVSSFEFSTLLQKIYNYSTGFLYFIVQVHLT